MAATQPAVGPVTGAEDDRDAEERHRRVRRVPDQGHRDPRHRHVEDVDPGQHRQQRPDGDAVAAADRQGDHRLHTDGRHQVGGRDGDEGGQPTEPGQDRVVAEDQMEAPHGDHRLDGADGHVERRLDQALPADDGADRAPEHGGDQQLRASDEHQPDHQWDLAQRAAWVSPKSSNRRATACPAAKPSTSSHHGTRPPGWAGGATAATRDQAAATATASATVKHQTGHGCGRRGARRPGWSQLTRRDPCGAGCSCHHAPYTAEDMGRAAGRPQDGR